MRFGFGRSPFDEFFREAPRPQVRYIMYGGRLIKCPDGIYRPYYEQSKYLLEHHEDLRTEPLE